MGYCDLSECLVEQLAPHDSHRAVVLPGRSIRDGVFASGDADDASLLADALEVYGDVLGDFVSLAGAV